MFKEVIRILVMMNMNRKYSGLPIHVFIVLLLLMSPSCKMERGKTLKVSEAYVIIGQKIPEPFGTTAETVLIEELQKRSGPQLETTTKWNNGTTIAIALQTDSELYGEPLPQGNEDTEIPPEGFRLAHTQKEGRDILWIIGADPRGVFYGIGKLLRTFQIENGELQIEKGFDFSEAPKYALRGHQFGYRNTANSWDAWTVEQFDQHFREQLLFGANSFENIPFQDTDSSPHFKVDPQKMEVELSNICAKYDVDYWVWTPAPRDLKEKNAHEEGLAEQAAFYERCPRLNGVFVPGGDPGENHPKDLIPYLRDLAQILKRHHPNAGIWVSLQGFNEEKVRYFFDYLEKEKPSWFRGLVNGPSSPPLHLERQMLPDIYAYRFYPDITHTIRCHYPVDRWDQAFALTLGREPCNPQPVHYAKLFRRDSPHTDGFITYSDGTHDDINKIVWSQLGWNPNENVKTTVLEYTRFFFGPKVAQQAMEGILALEKNWEGPLLGNPQVSQTLKLWQGLDAENPNLQGNWRWQQLLMRAYYDTYIQERQAYERKLETEAYGILSEAGAQGADQVMKAALAHLNLADTQKVAQELRQKVFQYAAALNKSIGAQTSVPLYQASGAERGAILDFIDHPLNNRWWLEDEFEKIGALKTEEAKLERLEFLRNYENPGEGSFYDNISSADAKHVVSKTDDAIDFLWENNGLSRKRLSTQLFQFSPVLEYDELNPKTQYLIRVSGYGEALLKANGQRLKPTKYEKGFEEFKEFPLPKERIVDGKLKITFDKPDEEHLNWRKQSRVTDVWILKQ
ncbi:MAG: hypothetical protein AAGA86_00985 [Bacteroidota bacterium]